MIETRRRFLAGISGIGAAALLQRNLLLYGVGGIIAPFIGIKFIDVLLTYLRVV